MFQADNRGQYFYWWTWDQTGDLIGKLKTKIRKLLVLKKEPIRGRMSFFLGCHISTRNTPITAYSTKLNSMILSLEYLLANRRAKKTVSIRHIIEHEHDNNINTNTNISTTEVWSAWFTHFMLQGAWCYLCSKEEGLKHCMLQWKKNWFFFSGLPRYYLSTIKRLRGSHNSNFVSHTDFY